MKLKALSILIVAFLYAFKISAQTQEKTAEEFQKELNEQFADEKNSPLSPKDRKQFSALPFFPVNSKYTVTATLTKVKNAIPFQMQTTTDRKPSFVVYAEARFLIDGKEYKLNLYRNTRAEELNYHNLLFLPFTDATNGNDSYGGGRFIDLEIPEGDTIKIDFNKAYNPYCAYNNKYSCPVPPKENDLNIRIEAGVKYESH